MSNGDKFSARHSGANMHEEYLLEKGVWLLQKGEIFDCDTTRGNVRRSNY